jgi:bifunctional polynucleotide phosphatase/kinase
MFQDEITKNGMIYYYQSLNIKSSSKILVMDLDHTLIQPKSGKKHPINNDDWKFLINPELLNCWQEDGWHLVIMTNQKRMRLEDINYKLINIIKILESMKLKITCLVATKEDFFRKPSIGMWEFLSTKLNTSPINNSSSFMIGDATGETGTHSACDIMLAENIGIHFMTPEIFINEFKIPMSSTSIHATPSMKKIVNQLNTNTKYFNPQKYICSIGEVEIARYDEQMKLLKSSLKSPFLIIMMGAQCSGKSSFITNMINKWKLKDIEIMSYDTFIGTKTKFKKHFIESVNTKKNIIIDNTNGKIKERQQFLQLVPAVLNYTKILVYLDLPKQLVMHLNDIRTKEINAIISTNSSIENIHNIIPDVAIHSYYKYLEPPSSKEDYSQIIKLEILNIEEIKHHNHFLEWNC